MTSREHLQYCRLNVKKKCCYLISEEILHEMNGLYLAMTVPLQAVGRTVRAKRVETKEFIKSLTTFTNQHLSEVNNLCNSFPDH
jgi:hypothetical protein